MTSRCMRMTSTDQVLGRSRPLASEVTARSHAHLVAREVETRARGPEAGHAGLGISFGFLLMIVDLPGYPYVHGIPFSSFLKNCIINQLIINQIKLPLFDVEIQVWAGLGPPDWRLETGARMILRGRGQTTSSCSCRTGSQVHPAWVHPSS